jgi:hypothetical protein
METITERGGTSAVIENDSLRPHEIAAFLEGRLEGEELTRVELYLADHPSARQELIKASRIIQTAPQKEVKRSRRLYPLIGLAAAAAIAVVFIRPAAVNQLKAPVATERRGVADEADQVVLVSPLDAGEIKDRAQPLTWHAVDGATYAIVITDASGNKVVQTTTSDTSLVLPEGVKADGTYYWRVDANSPDGSSSTSGYHEFRLIGR